MVLVVKNLPANAGDVRDVSSIPVVGRCPGRRHGNPLQHSCLENPMDRGAWWTRVHGIIKSQFSSVQLLSRVQLFAAPWTAARQASLSITNSRSLPKLMFIESVMPSYHLILFIPFFSCPQPFPASGSFQLSQLFTSGGQSIGVSTSTSVLPVDTQD